VGQTGLWVVVFGQKTQDKILKSFVTDMITILNQMLRNVCVEKGYIDDSSFFEKLIGGKVKISNNLKKWLWGLLSVTM
jgi:hypothetical protein